MRVRRRGSDRLTGPEQGFTLIEVVVALFILTFVMVSVAGLFFRAVHSATSLDRRQAAVAVADQSMELARGIPAQLDAASNSKLISGRAQSAVAAQWAAATVDLSQTDEAWDTTATAASEPNLPLSSTTTVAGVTYTAQRYVGSCYRPAAGGDCVKAVSKAADSRFMYRVIVQVTWTEGAGTSCSGSACSYALSTLVDPSADPSFNVNATNATWPAAPVLNALNATTAIDTPVTVDVASAVVSGATPLTAVVTNVTQGATASVQPNTTQITITPASGYSSGTDIVVTYRLTDPYEQSTASTITVHVAAPCGGIPVAVQDGSSGSPGFSVGMSSTTVVDVLANDTLPAHCGTATVTIVDASSNTHVGSARASGSTVTFKSKRRTGTVAFTYKVTNSAGDSATVNAYVRVS